MTTDYLTMYIEGRKAIKASNERQRYHRVQKKNSQNLDGISENPVKDKPPPKRAINIFRNKYLDPKQTTLDWQYYAGQEADKSLEFYAEQGRKAIEASYRNKYNRNKSVEKKGGDIFNGISVTGVEKLEKPPIR